MGCANSKKPEKSVDLPQVLSAKGFVLGDPSSNGMRIIPKPDTGTCRPTSTLIDDKTYFGFHVPFEEVEFLSKVGSGKYGEVHKAMVHGKEVAVKKLYFPDSPQEQKVVMTDFAKEVRLLSLIQHTNIVRFLGAVQQAPKLCLITELLAGSVSSLLSLVAKRQTKITWGLVFRIALDAVNAMCYLHSLTPAILHRDLKAENLLVSQDFKCKLTDFGLSRMYDSTTTMTVCGTPSWVAPEIFRGENYTEKVDVYSFAIVLWELTCFRKPYVGTYGLELPYLVGEKGVRPHIPRHIPEALRQLMTRSWDQNPAKRPTFPELQTELNAIGDRIDLEEVVDLRINYEHAHPSPEDVGVGSNHTIQSLCEEDDDAEQCMEVVVRWGDREWDLRLPTNMQCAQLLEHLRNETTDIAAPQPSPRESDGECVMIFRNHVYCHPSRSLDQVFMNSDGHATNRLTIISAPVSKMGLHARWCTRTNFYKEPRQYLSVTLSVPGLTRDDIVTCEVPCYESLETLRLMIENLLGVDELTVGVSGVSMYQALTDVEIREVVNGCIDKGPNPNDRIVQLTSELFRRQTEEVESISYDKARERRVSVVSSNPLFNFNSAGQIDQSSNNISERTQFSLKLNFRHGLTETTEITSCLLVPVVVQTSEEPTKRSLLIDCESVLYQSTMMLTTTQKKHLSFKGEHELLPGGAKKNSDIHEEDKYRPSKERFKEYFNCYNSKTLEGIQFVERQFLWNHHNFRSNLEIQREMLAPTDPHGLRMLESTILRELLADVKEIARGEDNVIFISPNTEVDDSEVSPEDIKLEERATEKLSTSDHIHKFTQKLQERATYVSVIGDMNGDFLKLMTIFQLNGRPSPTNQYLFLGDLSHNGFEAVQILVLVFLYKRLYPEHVHILSGNRDMYRASNGIPYHCPNRDLFIDVLRSLPVAAVVASPAGGVFCCNGAPLKAFDDVRISDLQKFDRFNAHGLPAQYFNDLRSNHFQAVQATIAATNHVSDRDMSTWLERNGLSHCITAYDSSSELGFTLLYNCTATILQSGSPKKQSRNPHSVRDANSSFIRIHGDTPRICAVCFNKGSDAEAL
eukprot:TRINITY_DN230763_c0_g1_i1.p1 TRINITY_DN230763_c0_g1~~TRINITY_DN230763_c0_g1_i1.p1  ORF type:complete len:1081 (+),score=288.09 TRINITY_DN230763_c0_g1_i1:73-3315(+)